MTSTLPGRGACFNPLPSQKQGETRIIFRIRRLVQRFNPLPSQKQGETPVDNRSAGSPPCFNPLPSQKQGETGFGSATVCGFAVSIRSPHKSKGRHCQSLQVPWFISLFQSAPLTKARGDLLDRARRGKVLRFQSAPLTKARGDFYLLADVY